YTTRFRSDVDHARELRQAEDLVARHVADRGGAEEGQHVVLAQRVELDAREHHHLRALGLEQGAVDDLPGVLPVAAGEEPQRPLDALRGLRHALAGDVLAEGGDELCDERLEARLAHLVEVVCASETNGGVSHEAVMLAQRRLPGGAPCTQPQGLVWGACASTASPAT